MKRFLLAAACIALGVVPLTSRAADISPDGQRLMAYAEIGITVGMCGLQMTPEQTKRAQDSMDTYGDRQADFSADQFTDKMKQMAAEMRPHKDRICAEARAKGVDGLLDEVDAGPGN